MCQWAKPRNTRSLRSSSSMCTASRCPTTSPMLDRRTVVTLSIMMKLGDAIPVFPFAGKDMRIKGASTCTVVSGHTVTESVATKRSS